MGTFHVTNGDGAAAVIEPQVAPEPVLPWRDMLHEGPVPAGLDLEALSAVRAQCLAEALRLDLAPVAEAFAMRDRRLREAVLARDRFVLWFEHDLYDQLQLVQVLALLDEQGVGSARIELALADTYLAEMRPGALACLPRSGAGARQVGLAVAAWSAVRSATPEAMAALVAAGTPALPRLGPALARFLAELPAPGTGLSRTERLILERLEDEPATAGDLFAAVGAADEPRFLGDWPFFARLDRLAAPPRALVEGLPGPCPYGSLETMQAYARSTVRITATGRETMAGRLDWFAARQEARWLGGTRLEPSRPWRWEPATGTLSRG